MEKNKTLYKTFTELALKVVLTKGMDLLEAKKVVIQKFENHPFEKNDYWTYRRQRAKCKRG